MLKNLHKFTAIKSHYINAPIYQKLVVIFGILSLCLFSVSLLAIQYTFLNGQKLLYSSISSLMKNPAEEIQRQISYSKDLSQTLLSHATIQNSLSDLKDSGIAVEDASYSSAYSNISNIMYQALAACSSDCISYVAITNNVITLSTYNRGKNLPSQIKNDIVEQAEKAAGSPALITDYCNNYGLFLGRTIRRMDSLKLDSLGTIIINIDIHSLIEKATNTISLSENVAYMLFEQNNPYPFYTTENLSHENVSISLNKDYDIFRIGNDKYFVVKGFMPDSQWEYLCLIEYNSILASHSRAKLVCFITVLLCVIFIFLLSKKIFYSLTLHFNVLVQKMIVFGKDNSRLPQTKYDYSNRKDEIGILHNQFDIMARQIQTLINENYKNELLKKDMMLKNLQNQINPHFLYNTLESINWRAKASGEDEISQMVEALGALLRTSLSPQSLDSTIESEMKIVHDYITIQKIRFEDRLVYSESIVPDLQKIKVPCFVVQPLVENAIRYGLESNIGKCSIEVSVKIIKGILCIQVLNDGSQFEDNMIAKLENNEIIPHGFGIGILNIHKRIQMIYGEGFGISLSNPDEDHALSEITLPINISSEKGDANA